MNYKYISWKAGVKIGTAKWGGVGIRTFVMSDDIVSLVKVEQKT